MSRNRLSRSWGGGEDLMKGMDFNAFKNSMECVWIFRCKLLRFFE